MFIRRSPIAPRLFVRLAAALAAVVGASALTAYCDPPAAAPAPAAPLKFTTTQTSLGTLTPGSQSHRTVFSPDARHIAYPRHRPEDGKWSIVRDGVEGKPYEWISPNSLVFSPDSSHLAYLTQTGEQLKAIIDDVEQKAYPEVSRPVFSPDGKHFAYVVRLARDAKGVCVVFDGKEGRQFDKIFIPSLAFSPDSSHFAFTAEVAGKNFWVLDDKDLPQYDAVGRSISFSPDSAHHAYMAERNGEQFEVIDGKEQKHYSFVGNVAFSPDGAHHSYPASKDRRFFAVIDEKESESYDAVSEPILSRDGRHYAFIARTGKLYSIVRDGQAGPAYDLVIDPTFSADSQHLAYHALDHLKHRVILDDKEGAPYDAISPGSIALSPDGSRLAYAARTEEREFLVLNAQEIPGAGNILMSPDGKYVAHLRDNPPQKHTSSLWVNDSEGPEFDGFLRNAPWVFNAPNKLTCMVGHGLEIIRAEIEIAPK